MAVDNIARALAAKAIAGGGAGSVTPEDLEKKYDKTGGAISGDVAIQGNLTVSGTTTTEKEKQLLVEDNVIVTNANKIDLTTLLSGLAINKNENAVYGIMYDPTDDTVKFGEGTLDENNKFTFKTGEGLPIAIREDSTKFTNAHLVKWDATKKSFVDAGIDVASLSKKIKSLDLSYGAQVVTYDTADGMNVKSQARITYSDDTTEDVNDEIEIPIVAGDGLNMDAITDNSKVVFKIDPEKSVYMAATPTATNAIPVKTGNSWTGTNATPSAEPSSVVTRDAHGRAQFGTPVNDADAATKGFVESSSSKIGTSAADNKKLKAIYYTEEDGIPETPEEGAEYAVVGLVGYSDLDSDLQEKIDNVPTWKTTAPVTDADKKKVQFTKVIISTTDDTNFPGMNGRYAIVPGFTNDGFHYGTVVCSQADPAYEFPFIGSITSEMASGTIVNPSVSPTYISVVDPQVTFTYEYLW